MIDSSSAAVDMETDEGAKMLAMYGNLEVSAALHFAVADAYTQYLRLCHVAD